MRNRRVAITGAGVISALGPNADSFWAALRAGRSGIAPVESVDRSELRFSNGAEVRGYQALDFFTGKQADLLDRFAQFGSIAAREAIGCAGIVWTKDLRLRTAIVTGSCVGGQTTQDQG